MISETNKKLLKILMLSYNFSIFVFFAEVCYPEIRLISTILNRRV